MEEKRSRKGIIGFLILVAIIVIIAICLVVVIISNNVNKSESMENKKCEELVFTNGGVISGFGILGKPIIYLYPEEEINVSVKLGYPDKVTCSYPKYEDGWNVVANPNGDLKYIETERNLYALYYESDNVYNYKVEKDGFVVKKEDIASFLEEKLEILGLNEREAEEFIVYWLPKLEENEYTYIRFATEEEINKNMPIEIEPTPDTLIRVIMTYKGLNKSIEVEEQRLKTPERTGFIAVEWGGTEIKL